MCIQVEANEPEQQQQQQQPIENADFDAFDLPKASVTTLDQSIDIPWGADPFGAPQQSAPAPPPSSDDPWGAQSTPASAAPWPSEPNQAGGADWATFDDQTTNVDPFSSQTFGERAIDVDPFAASPATSHGGGVTGGDAWNELIATEQDYLRQLEFVHSAFYPVLQQAGAANVVNNWPQLVEQAQLMVMMLDSNPVPSTFAESVTAEFVNVYADYCATQRSMCDTLVKRKSFDAEFRTAIEGVESSGAAKGLKLDAYLLVPMQRITKYPDLLRKVKKHAPQSEGIDRAIQKAEFLLQSVNSSVAVLEDATKTDWLVTHVTTKQGTLPNELNNIRSVFHCDHVVKKKSNRALLAFLCKTNHAKTLLLLTTSKTAPPVDLAKLYTSNCRLDMYRSVYTVVQAQKEDDLSFVIIAKEGKVSLRASSIEKQAEWLRKCTTL